MNAGRRLIICLAGYECDNVIRAWRKTLCPRFSIYRKSRTQYRFPFTREYAFMVNVKLGSQQAKQIADPDLESQFYPWRDTNYAR